MCDYVQNRNDRPSRYIKTGGKTKKDTETQRSERNTPRYKKRRRRRKKHHVVTSEPEKCLGKLERELQPDNGVLQEPRRLDEDGIKQADCG